MNLRRAVRISVGSALSILLLIALTGGALWWYFHPSFTRTDGVVNTQRHGQNLTFDVIRPAHPNGLGILLMNSGSWRSSGPGSFRTFIMAAPLLRHGYSIFAVSHLSQPKATVTEMHSSALSQNRSVLSPTASFGRRRSATRPFPEAVSGRGARIFSGGKQVYCRLHAGY